MVITIKNMQSMTSQSESLSAMTIEAQQKEGEYEAAAIKVDATVHTIIGMVGEATNMEELMANAEIFNQLCDEMVELEEYWGTSMVAAPKGDAGSSATEGQASEASTGSAMVVYGFLTYHEGILRIPNHELMLKFRQALASETLSLNQTLVESQKLLDATLNREHDKVADILEDLHNEKIPFFNYHDENSLACVVTVGYLAALDIYRIEREDKAGKGYADFTFTPIKKSDTPIILELKYGHSAENALQCIHERDYIKKFKEYSRVLLVGINYSEATKKHTCLTEVVERGCHSQP